MVEKFDVLEVVENLSEYVERITRIRQDDEAQLKQLINRLNSHCCSVNCDGISGWPEKEEIMKNYDKAREDRDEYKFRLNECKTQIKELKEELAIAKRKTAQLNTSGISYIVPLNQRNTGVYNSKLELDDSSNTIISERELSTVVTASDEALKRELSYLHKTNQEFLNEIRKLKSDLVSQDVLMEKLKHCEEEIANLKRVNEEKQIKMIDMQVKFDEEHKNSKRDNAYHMSLLNNKLTEMQAKKDELEINLEVANQEIKLLKQISIKKTGEEAAEHTNSIQYLENDVPHSEQTNDIAKNETADGNVQRRKRVKLQSIENTIASHHPGLISTPKPSSSEEKQVSVDEVKDLSHGITKRLKRVQKVGRGSKDPAVRQKQEVEKAVQTKSSVITRRKAKDYCTDATPTNSRQKNKLIPGQETDENVDPCPLESSSSSVFNASGEINLTEYKPTPDRKPGTKVQGDKKRTNRRRNK